jgi:hypothetical protein
MSSSLTQLGEATRERLFPHPTRRGYKRKALSSPTRKALLSPTSERGCKRKALLSPS